MMERADGKAMGPSSTDFRRRALAESCRYGGDPFVFVREMGQNSRDAGATRIEISKTFDQNRVSLVFDDNGAGMTFDHARRYLFCLYASSKEKDAGAAGRYGVGFWSVLRFEPCLIEVHSRCDGEGFAVALDGTLESWKSISCERKTPGTTVRLVKPCSPEQWPALSRELEQALERYLVHLRTSGRRPKAMEVILDGKRVDRPLQLNGPAVLSFREGSIEGVVGFGPSPSYQLYARGLPVASGAFLDELEGKRSVVRKQDKHEGVAPVFVLNGNNLDVVLSRQAVIKSRALEKLLCVSRRHFDQLVRSAVDGNQRCSWARRMARVLFDFRWGRSGPAILGKMIFWFLLLLLIGGAGGWLVAGLTSNPLDHAQKGISAAADPVAGVPDRLPTEPEPRFDDKGLTLQLGTVSAPESGREWALRYEPAQPLWLRLMVLSEYHPMMGWRPVAADGRVPAATQQANGIRIAFRSGGKGGRQFLPVPTRTRPVKNSLRLGNQEIPFWVTDANEMIAELPSEGDGWLTYVAVSDIETNVSQEARMTRLSAFALPVQVEQALQKLRSLARGEQPAQAVAITNQLIRYDQSAATVEAYRRLQSQRDKEWLESVIDIGAGDCDVINGLLAVLLRKLDWPARLVVGIVGREGRGVPGLHAWVEVYDRGWKVLDATSMVAVEGRNNDEAPAQAQENPGSLLAPTLATIAREPGPAPAGEEVAAQPTGRSNEQKVVRPEARPKDTSLGSWPMWLGFIGIGLVVLAVVLLGNWGGRRQVKMDDDPKSRNKLLAEVVTDVVRHPHAWKHAPAIWSRAFLPCLGGRRISLRRMLMLSREGRIFVGRPDCELAKEALRSRALVLDASDEHFGRFYGRLEGLRHLEDLQTLRPLAIADIPQAQSDPSLILWSALAQQFSQKRPTVACLPVRWPTDDLCLDIDLSPIRPSRDSGWRRRYVAVNLESSHWKKLCALHQQSPRAGLAIAVDWVVASSEFLAPRANKLRKWAARLALRG